MNDSPAVAVDRRSSMAAAAGLPAGIMAVSSLSVMADSLRLCGLKPPVRPA